MVAASLLVPGEAFAMRCKSKIITKGDIQAKVLKYCGEPTTAQTRFAERFGAYRSTDRRDLDNRVVYSPYFRSEVIIEEWVYNLGPSKLMRRITFENGVVVDVETLERGFTE